MVKLETSQKVLILFGSIFLLFVIAFILVYWRIWLDPLPGVNTR